MTDEDSQKQPSSRPSGGAMWLYNLQHPIRSHTTPLWLTLLSTACLIVLMWLMARFGERMENIEDQLKYQPPAIKSPQLALSKLPALNPRSIQVANGQKVYVPAYSHIYGEGGKPFLLETTLSIRNTDPENTINITSVMYFDTEGELIKEHIDGQLLLKPLETAAFLVEKTNKQGGSGANFIISWHADKAVYEPLIEAVMVGFDNKKSISFTSPGRPLIERK